MPLTICEATAFNEVHARHARPRQGFGESWYLLGVDLDRYKTVNDI